MLASPLGRQTWVVPLRAQPILKSVLCHQGGQCLSTFSAGACRILREGGFEELSAGKGDSLDYFEVIKGEITTFVSDD